MEPIVIVSAKRTPIGHLGGVFKNISATTLGSCAINATLKTDNFSTDKIDQVLMGCVLPAGLGQAPARQAALAAGLSINTPCVTVNKMCGSGLKTVALAYDQLLAGSHRAIIAGGMEGMSGAPYLINKARFGYRFGDGVLIDHMLRDGLQDAYEPKPMGYFAERCASQYKIDRNAQDDWARQSFDRAKLATDNGAFADELTPVVIKNKTGESVIASDEGVTKINPDKIAQLKPAFADNGTVTAANASSISDGAAALLLMRESNAKICGLKPLAKILGVSEHAHEPDWFTTAPVTAIKKLLDNLSLTVKDIDLFEINEAFAVVTLVAIQQLKLDPARVNVHGGACVLGHPIGASGARILVTLLNALKQKGGKRGIASLCIGGGEALALAVELV